MKTSISNSQQSLQVVLLTVTLLVTGCAGIEPYEPRDHREEGPEYGLFTGSDGEFVILKKDKLEKRN